ncbi:hypothetical protein ACFQU2_12755 [Siccirubricoccus deserti]
MISRRLLLGAGLAAPFIARAETAAFPNRAIRYICPARRGPPTTMSPASWRGRWVSGSA